MRVGFDWLVVLFRLGLSPVEMALRLPVLLLQKCQQATQTTGYEGQFERIFSLLSIYPTCKSWFGQGNLHQRWGMIALHEIATPRRE